MDEVEMMSDEAQSMESTDRSLRFRIREPGVAWRRVVDDMVLLDVDKSVYHGLNQTGALVWEGLAAGHTVGELIDRVAAAFPGNVEAAARDVPPFLYALVRGGLIEVQTDGAIPADDPG